MSGLRRPSLVGPWLLKGSGGGLAPAKSAWSMAPTVKTPRAGAGSAMLEAATGYWYLLYQLKRVMSRSAGTSVPSVLTWITTW
jgi:hypothetical protein